MSEKTLAVVVFLFCGLLLGVFIGSSIITSELKSARAELAECRRTLEAARDRGDALSGRIDAARGALTTGVLDADRIADRGNRIISPARAIRAALEILRTGETEGPAPK